MLMRLSALGVAVLLCAASASTSSTVQPLGAGKYFVAANGNRWASWEDVVTEFNNAAMGACNDAGFGSFQIDGVTNGAGRTNGYVRCEGPGQGTPRPVVEKPRPACTANDWTPACDEEMKRQRTEKARREKDNESMDGL